MVDEAGLRELRSSLGADGYVVEVDEGGGRVGVRISATSEACPDCLVPKDLMRRFFQQALGVPEHSIDLTYPDE
ncbi:MAG: hypothetical protein ACRDN9_00425 [Streptosporangiaceae bacterium]